MHVAEMFPNFQFPVQVTIDGRTLDYLLTVDETGHVFEAIPTIFELPLTAQKLILGETDGQLERKIRAYTHLFKYLVPLALVRKLPTYQEVLTPLVAEIERRLQEKGMKLEDLPDAFISSTFGLQVLSVYDPNKVASPHLVDVWTKIASIIENLGRETGSNEIWSLGRYETNPASGFLPAIMPFLNFQTQRVAFECLEYKKKEPPKRYLLEELEVPSCQPYAEGILKALRVCKSERDDIYDAVIRFYDRSKKLNGGSLAYLIEILGDYPTLRTKEIGFEIFHLNESYAAESAAKSLLKIGIDEKELVEALLPYFEKADYDTSTNKALSVFYHISAENLPDVHTILDVFIRMLSKSNNPNLAYSMIRLAEKTGLFLLPNLLFELLSHESSGVRGGILELINCAEKGDKVPVSDYRTAEMANRFLELAYDPNRTVAGIALRLLRKIGSEQKTTIYINHFLKIIALNPQDISLRIEAMRAINETLYYVPYQNQIEPTYLAALEESNYNYRVAALNGFRHSPNESFKKTLQRRFQEDPQQEVRSAANNLFPSPLRIFKDTSKKTPGILGRISAFLEDFLSI